MLMWFPCVLVPMLKVVSFQEVLAARTEHSLVSAEPFPRQILRKTAVILSAHRSNDVLRQPPAFLALSTDSCTASFLEEKPVTTLASWK